MRANAFANTAKAINKRLYNKKIYWDLLQNGTGKNRQTRTKKARPNPENKKITIPKAQIIMSGASNEQKIPRALGMENLPEV